MPAHGDTYTIRPADADDLAGIVSLLADDPIGRRRESPLAIDAYHATFARLRNDPATHLLIAADAENHVIGYLQMTITRHLSYRGASRALLEDLRVSPQYRGQGIGRHLVTTATDIARQAGCTLLQLFVHRSRDRAQRFYHHLGFEAEHLGLRLTIDESAMVLGKIV